MSFSRTWAPIALFAYNRADHLRRTVEALARNGGAGESDLHIFSDGPRNEAAAARVAEVRAWLPQITGFKSVRVVERDRNLGLAKSIIGGVTELLARHERLIVLEDDMVTSPFLRYMNEALELYADTPEVISVHGYVFPLPERMPEIFFLRGADCWGWATWRRAWSIFEPDGRKLLAELERRGLGHEFDFQGSVGYMRMLRNQIAGLNDSWAVRWYASAFLAGKLTLHPGRSLVQNIGNDGSGRHCGNTESMDTRLSDSSIEVTPISLEESFTARGAIRNYYRRTNGWRAKVARLKSKLARIIG